MSGIKSAKSILRKEMKNLLTQLSTEEKQKQSKRVLEKLCSLRQYQESRRVSVYLSTNDEVDTLPILKHIFASGKEVFVPRYKGSDMQMVKILSIEDYEKLPLTKWNIKQPSSKEIRENALETGGLDLILLPGVAFTMNGKRLGHGMGYYDKFLKSCFEKQVKKPHLIGLAWNEQIREEIPTTEQDVNLDLVLTGNEI